MNRYRILFVVSRLPYAPDTGDGLRAYYFLRGLADRGYQVDLLGFHDVQDGNSLSHLSIWCENVYPVHTSNLGFPAQNRIKQIADMVVGAKHGFPRRVWQYHSQLMLETFSKLIHRTSYEIVHFSEVGVAELLYKLPTDRVAAKVYDLIDAVSLSIENSLRYRIDITWPTRLIEAHMLRHFEMQIIDDADAGILISPRDKSYLGNKSNAYVIPNGIDVSELPKKTKKMFDIMFHGNFSSKSNSDAVLWFVRTALPLIWEKSPEATFAIVGRNPPPSVQQLASERIIVIGAVEDIHAYIRQAKLSVAPLRFGAGQKNKLLEAFVNAVPVVATREANEGTGAEDGDSIILCDDPGKMADAIIELLNNESQREKIGYNGYLFARRRFSWDESLSALEKVYEKAYEKALVK